MVFSKKNNKLHVKPPHQRKNQKKYPQNQFPKENKGVHVLEIQFLLKNIINLFELSNRRTEISEILL